MMNEMNEMNENLSFVELDDNELEDVTGGKKYKIGGDTGKSNVRTGPGLSYKSIGVLHKGEEAKYLGKSARDDRGVVWYKIDWKGRNAWVSSRYTAKVIYK